MTVAGLAVFLALMFWGVRRPLRKIERSYLEHGELSDNLKALLLLLLMLSALVTEALGLHLLFGAFIAGAIMPKNRDFVAYVIEKFDSITVLLLCLQLEQFALGMTLVLCFSIGLALTMVAAGSVAALSVRHVSRRWSGFGMFARRAPYLSSIVIISVGLYLGYQGLSSLP